MNAVSEHHEHSAHHELPTRGRALDAVALSATLHCLTGCAIGEVLGMIIGTALGFSDWGTIALAVTLAFFFGYSLTSLPLLRAGLTLGAVIPIALASDTFSIATMEVVDNAIMLAVPGAMEAGVGDVLFWGALSVALVVAGFFAFPVNRWLIKRGKGHVAVHNTGIHGGPPTKVVAAVAIVAGVFGAAVLIADLASGDGGGHGAGDGAEQQTVRGLAVSDAGMTLSLASDSAVRGRKTTLVFTIDDSKGRPLRDFEVEHEKRMHLIVVRRDMAGFQHLHPKMADDGTWSTPLELGDAGMYRVFADFKRDGRNHTLAGDLSVDGPVDWQQLPEPALDDETGGYEVKVEGGESKAGEPSELSFSISRDGNPVEPEPYLGAGGHLVALRDGDLAYLHVHPAEHGAEEGHAAGPEPVMFETEFPTAGRYRLFLQFKHEGSVRTAEFTREVAR